MMSIVGLSQPDPKVVEVYILAGQSNMDGLGLVAELPRELLEIQSEVYIYNPNRRNDQESLQDIGYWEQLRPGHGSGFSTDGSRSYYSDKFGIELSFSKHLKTLQPDIEFALFKYAKGGASIHPDAAADYGSWHPYFENGNGINQWDHFMYQYNRAMHLADFDGENKEVIFKPMGFLWLQGESDASFSHEIAESYEENLTYLIQRVRELTGVADLPIVIAQISESNLADTENGKVLVHGEVVMRAQYNIAANNNNVAIIYAPENIGWLDNWHYDSNTYVELGRRFAEAIYTMKTEKK